MTYPNYQPAAPQQPQYPAQQPQYPAQQPQYPAQQPQYPAQASPQGQYPQAPPPQDQEPLPKTGLSDYVDQPAIGGTSLQFPAEGHWHRRLTVSRPLGDGDFPVQTTMPDQFGRRQVKTFGDGRPMVRMAVPVFLPQPDAEHPDGLATLNVQGQMGEALKRAMDAVGAGHLKGIPEDHSVIDVGWTDHRPSKRQGHQPQHIYTVIYQRPPGAAQADAATQWQRDTDAIQPPPAQYASNGQQAPVAQPPFQATPSPQTQPQYVPPVGQQPVPQPAGQIPPPQYQQPFNGQAGMQQSAPEMQHASQWPAPSAPLSVPPSPAPAGTNPYNNPALPPNQPDVAGQVAYATQAGITAAQQAQAPQQGQQPAPPPGMSAENAALIAQLTGQAPLQ